ncbi:unnamed protein product [Acanthoscelides obtectus]|uniref:DH domain-containing protein n=1 Tax=Acanthoscelides obtectus TaxID=200917 RepID=A0A9P0K2S0_ACAOB|nr:unnamed protein product [Acanthoscelides obtectus]CAK1629028.1 Rho guanine nucleotide exchange factor 17 [Acanthoscelides obtectus]
MLKGLWGRLLTMGAVRYGTRAVSPPPPGAGRSGLRYRSTATGCWPPPLSEDASGGGIETIDALVPLPVSRMAPINSLDIISSASRMDATAVSDQPRLQSVRDHVLYGGKCLLKKRCALVRPQVYARLATDSEDLATLDRLPRFRFGGNRASAADKRYRDLSDRLKRTPVPPPRNRHPSRSTPQTSPTPPEEPADCSERVTPLRSSSFSQVDYCTDNNKYVKRLSPDPTKETSTLPRSKHTSRPNTPTPEPLFVVKVTDSDGNPSNLPESYKKHASNDKKRDKSRRRKGIYISQWPNNYQASEDVIPQFVGDEDFSSPDNNAQLLQDSIVEISKLQSPEKDPWESPKEPQSPEDSDLAPKWPLPKPKQSSASPDDKLKHAAIFRTDSLSDAEPEVSECKSDQVSFIPSDISDCESRVSASTEPTSPTPRRYSKRPLRGPYGQMLEAEMKKPEARKNLSNDLKFLDDLSNLTNDRSRTVTPRELNNSLDETKSNSQLYSPKQLHQRKISADNLIVPTDNNKKLVVSHQRTTSSPSKLQDFANIEVSSELLEQLLRGSSEQLAAADAQQNQNDTRTHVVIELYENEKSYVDSLEILVRKYLEPLKAPENASLLEPAVVDEIFAEIPFLLNQHQEFCNDLKKRLDQWDTKKKVGDLFLEIFSKPEVVEGYLKYVNSWKRSREILKTTQQQKSAFTKFLEHTARQHAGKLALDSLLIKPIQKFPKYELLLQRLIKHTDESHPDYNLLLDAEQKIHDLLVKINCSEKESEGLDQLKEIEGLVDGLLDLVSPERQYLRHDGVTISYCSGPRKERAIFLFSDLLLITSIKRRSCTGKKSNTGQGSLAGNIDAHKYKLLMRLPLEDLEVVRPKDDNYHKVMLEIENLTEDISTLDQINDLVPKLHCSHSSLEGVVKNMLASLHKQLIEQQLLEVQLSCLELTLKTPHFFRTSTEPLSIIFHNAEKRATWEEAFSDAKQKLVLTSDRRSLPEMIATVPVRKTRAGLQFTCAAPTLEEEDREVWVCNSDGYVGQLCVLSLEPEPNVVSCNGVCNSRITCISSIPALEEGDSLPPQRPKKSERTRRYRNQRRLKPMYFDSSSSSEEEEATAGPSEDPQTSSETDKGSEDSSDDIQPSTMWIGTEDGCIHVYNATDNIRTRRQKTKFQLNASVTSIVFYESKVFASVVNGELVVFCRDANGGWSGSHSTLVLNLCSFGMPFSKLLPSVGKLVCIIAGSIQVVHTDDMSLGNSLVLHTDPDKIIACATLNGHGIWLSIQNSATLKCYHLTTLELVYEINVAPAVTKMLAS